MISALSLLIYWPALQGGFVIDDDVLLTESELVHAPDGLYKFWFTTEPIDYWPITNSSFWLEWRLWGAHPTGYHVTNLILFIADALLVWAVLHVLKIPYAFVAAILFVVHPVNVESVAWIAQRKNVLSLFFFLLSLLCYLWSDSTLFTSKKALTRKSPSPEKTMGWYLLSLLSFVFAMLCKGSVATLPLLLILIAWWRRGHLIQRDFVRTIPFFAVAALLTVVNIWFRGHGPMQSLRDITFLERLLGAAAVVWFYLGKAILPIQLSFVYPQWHISSGKWQWWLPLLAGLLTTAVLWSQRRRPVGNAVLFSWCCFCAALLPVMGFIDIYFMHYSLVADHYQYLAIIPVLALVAAGLSAFEHRFFNHPTIAATSCVAVLVVPLSLLAWHQSHLYAGPLVLYRDTLEKNPDSSIIHNNFARTLADAGHLDQAIDECRQSVRLDPSNAEAYGNLGMVLYKAGRVEESLAPLEQTLGLRPGSAKAQYGVATALFQLGRLTDAIEHLEAAIRLDPNYPQAQALYGLALEKAGRLPEALEHIELAIELSPQERAPHFNCGNTLLQLRRPEEAIRQFQEAVRIDPNYLYAWSGLSTALAQAGRRDDAILIAERTISLARNKNQPDFAQRLESWLANYRSTALKQDVKSNQTEP